MKIKESDLSNPVVKYFEDLDYAVNCEVNGIDIVARKEEYLIAIELKLSFNMKLLFQVMDRLKFADEVYVALPRPKRRSKDLTKIRQLAELLNFGILFVDTGITRHVEPLYIPQSGNKPRNNKRKCRTNKEAASRSVELNTGGVRSVKIITAYREKCIAAASVMQIMGDVSTKELRTEYNFDKDIANVLRKNYYKWFEQTSDKRYALTAAAQDEIAATPEFKRLFDAYLEKYTRGFRTIDNRQ